MNTTKENKTRGKLVGGSLACLALAGVLYLMLRNVKKEG